MVGENNRKDQLTCREAMESEMTSLKEYIEIYDQKNKRLESELQREKEKNTSIEMNFANELAALREHDAKATMDFLLITNSQWWKLTAPGRAVMTRLKNGKTLGKIFNKIRAIKNHERIKDEAEQLSPLDKMVSDANGQMIVGEKGLFQEAINYGCMIKHPKQFKRNSKNVLNKPLLFVSHELSLTGAPVVLLHFAEQAIALGYQPVFYSPQDGDLADEILKLGISVIVDTNFHANSGETLKHIGKYFHLAVINTIVVSTAVKALRSCGVNIPILWWIHEAAISYDNPYILQRMPYTLDEHTHVFAVCDYARKELLKRRPLYDCSLLPYYMPDCTKDVKEDRDSLLPPHDGKRVFTMIGTMEYRKGFDILASAIAALPQKSREKCLFVIVGKPCYEPFDEIKEKLLSEFPKEVICFEKLSRMEINWLHAVSDCLICSSRDDPFPCVITEALSFAKPVICSEFTGYATIIEQEGCGLIYKENDPQQLSACIEELIGDTNLTKKMSKLARQTYIERFSAEAFRNNINTIFEQYIAKRSKEEQELATRPKASVSVVIPTYNAGEAFDDNLSMIEKQRGIDELEIIIVDSGSTDETVAICKARELKLIQMPNALCSHSFARNTGAAAASNDILLLLTQDARPSDERWLEKMIHPIISGEAAAVSCLEDTLSSSADLNYRIASWNHMRFIGLNQGDVLSEGLYGMEPMELRKHASLNDVAMAIDRRVFTRFQYRGNFAEDLALGIDLLRGGYRIKFLCDANIQHGHNRPIGYNLTRAFVTELALRNIMNEGLSEYREQTQLVCVIRQGFAIIGGVIEKLLNMDEIDSVEQFDHTFKELVREQYDAMKPDELSIKLMFDQHDQKIITLLLLLEALYPLSAAKMQEGVAAIMYYYYNLFFPYLKEKYQWHKTSVHELCQCLYRQMGSWAGGIISQCDPQCMLYRKVRDMSHGI